MLPTDSLAAVDFSNLQHLATTVGVPVKQMSAHTTSSLDNVISQLYSKEEQWMIVTNIQLLKDPEFALNKLLEVE